MHTHTHPVTLPPVIILATYSLSLPLCQNIESKENLDQIRSGQISHFSTLGCWGVTKFDPRQKDLRDSGKKVPCMKVPRLPLKSYELLGTGNDDNLTAAIF
jgi:hypothetical protein